MLKERKYRGVEVRDSGEVEIEFPGKVWGSGRSFTRIFTAASLSIEF